MRLLTDDPVNPARVPCNGCTLCCKGPGRVMLHPGLGDDPTKFDHEMVFDFYGLPTGFALKRKEDGSCIYLEDKGCAIWPNTPGVCRAFDCRDFAKSAWAAFLDPEGNNPVMRRGRELAE